MCRRTSSRARYLCACLARLPIERIHYSFPCLWRCDGRTSPQTRPIAVLSRILLKRHSFISATSVPTRGLFARVTVRSVLPPTRVAAYIRVNAAVNAWTRDMPTSVVLLLLPSAFAPSVSVATTVNTIYSEYGFISSPASIYRGKTNTCNAHAAINHRVLIRSRSACVKHRSLPHSPF